jgi:amidase
MTDFNSLPPAVGIICLEAQNKVRNSIPSKWRIDAATIKQQPNILDLPRASGLLTEAQLEITALDATSLLEKIHGGELSAVEVLEAFCGRAAIAQQATKCLTDFFYEEALEVARHLDQLYRETGKPVGVLHGLPICVKV